MITAKLHPCLVLSETWGGSPYKTVGRMPAWFFSIKVFMAFLQFHATHFAGLLVTPDTLTRTHSLYFLLVLIAINTRSSLEPFQNSISYRRMFDSNHLLFLFVLASWKPLEQSKIISELWHSGSNWRTCMSIATYRTTKNHDINVNNNAIARVLHTPTAT